MTNIKKCTKCKKEKECKEFNLKKRNPDGYQNICRVCSNARSRRYYHDHTADHKTAVKFRNRKAKKKIREWIIAYKKSHPCTCCGESEPCCLDFHHCRGKKEFVISEAGISSMKRLEAEVAKCDILCANCHRKHHFLGPYLNG